MKLLTAGTLREIPPDIISRFDGVVAGYWWDLWSTSPNKNIKAIAERYGKQEIWSKFLYGNRHYAPDPSSGTSTIEEWITKRISSNLFVTHWDLITEFINDNDNFNPYPMYQYEDIRRYIFTAKTANPNAKFIISDFRPYQLDRWQKIKSICEQLLSENVPIDGVGIQVHFKTSNAHSIAPFIQPYVLDALPSVIASFDGLLPVHITEASGWYNYTEKPDKLLPLWQELIAIATQGGCETFCPWWLNKVDEGYPKPMPSFEGFMGAGIFDKDWNKLLPLPSNQG